MLFVALSTLRSDSSSPLNSIVTLSPLIHAALTSSCVPSSHRLYISSHNLILGTSSMCAHLSESGNTSSASTTLILKAATMQITYATTARCDLSLTNNRKRTFSFVAKLFPSGVHSQCPSTSLVLRPRRGINRRFSILRVYTNLRVLLLMRWINNQCTDTRRLYSEHEQTHSRADLENCKSLA
ncbi:hypothetical protein BASA60_006953 [Batrachochytrium salamandrivorans]|nr:hypothetical protein BASA60_006953 [Batrachochytrium salamandrivorans]